MTEIKNMIHSYLHCARCVQERRHNDVEVGVTPVGIQVWCKRHDMNVAIITPATLATMIDQGPRCDVCGEPAGSEHKH